jgi:hypothetical protein
VTQRLDLFDSTYSHFSDRALNPARLLPEVDRFAGTRRIWGRPGRESPPAGHRHSGTRNPQAPRGASRPPSARPRGCPNSLGVRTRSEWVQHPLLPTQRSVDSARYRRAGARVPLLRHCPTWFCCDVSRSEPSDTPVARGSDSPSRRSSMNFTRHALGNGRLLRSLDGIDGAGAPQRSPAVRRSFGASKG